MYGLALTILRYQTKTATLPQGSLRGGIRPRDDDPHDHDCHVRARRHAVLAVTTSVTDPAVGTITGQDVVVVTAAGPELLTNSPWWDE